MSISSEITSIGTNLQADYKALQNLGADLTNIDKNIENIKSVAEQIYNNYPKTSYGEGTEVTLENCNKGKLDFDKLEGDTEQNGEPTPTNPITINSVTGNQEVVVRGKNLINTTEKNLGTSSQGVIQPTNTNYLGINDYTACKANTTYSILFEHDQSDATLYVSYKESNESFITRTSYGTARTFTTPSNAHLMFVYLYKNNANFSNGGYVQLEQGSSATTYEPYITPITKTLALGDIELNKIGTYQDYIYKSSGKWYVHKLIQKVVIDSSYRSTGGTTGTNAYYISTNISNGLDDNAIASAYSNMFSPCSFNNRNGAPDSVMLQSGSVVLRTRNNTDLDWSNNTKRDAWLNANLPIVYYVLATSTNTEITDTTLISQLEEIYNLMSITGTTIIETSGNLPIIIKARALKGE